jgi:hypothetical protein
VKPAEFAFIRIGHSRSTKRGGGSEVSKLTTDTLERGVTSDLLMRRRILVSEIV